MGKDEYVTKADLLEILMQSQSTTVASLFAMLKASQPEPVGPTAKIVAEIEAAERARAPQTIRSIRHRSRTGATMTLRVVDSKEFKHGRIVALDDYKHPEGWDRPVADGGLSSLPFYDPKTGHANAMAKQKAWEKYWRHDINTYVGQEYEPRFANMEPAAAAE